ncbi:MAG: hypothetical protein HZB61_14150 [Nitrospirae bacterium]|nr:hypothetical protein [Nitrospirota bacterium]
MKNQRSVLNFSVNRRMQLRIFFNIFLLSVLAAVVMAFVFYLYSDREIGESYRQFHIHAKNFLDFLLPAVGMSLFFTIMLSATIALFFPIRIAGPLFRIERDIREKVSRGDLTVKFQLRKGDEAGDLADAVNNCIEGLRNKVDTVRQSAKELEALVRADKGTANPDVEKLVAKINEELQVFKL